MSDSEGDETDRAERLRRQRSRSRDDDTPGDGQDPSDETATEARAETGETATQSVKDEWQQVAVYLPEDLQQDLNLRFEEINLEAARDGEEIEKLRDFYPAVIELGLASDELEGAVRDD